MISSTIISIVPRLPPSIDGVGDYALSLASNLYQSFGLLTHFIVCDPQWQGESSIGQFPIYALKQQMPTALSQALHKLSQDGAIVLLHFSGYGYAKWAVCDWLIEGLQIWKQEHRHANPDQASLVTMFHELYNCPGWPWQHNFWVSHTQKKIAQQLTQLTDLCVTNCQEYALELTVLSQGKHQNVLTLPVVSNVGEPKKVKPLADRASQLVIFGQTDNRRSLYRRSLHQIERLCRQLKITQIVDIGHPTGLDFERMSNLPLVEMGQLSAQAVSQTLQESQFGWLSYDTQRLGKSGVFAAYASHGMVPIVQPTNKIAPQASAIAMQRFLTPPQVSVNRPFPPPSLQQIAHQAWSTYQTYRQSQQIKPFASLLERNFTDKNPVLIVKD
jgi:hypothetical protein